MDGFDRDDGEAVPFHQPPGNRRARPVELRRPMRCFAEQNHARGAEMVERVGEVRSVGIGQTTGGSGDQAGKRRLGYGDVGHGEFLPVEQMLTQTGGRKTSSGCARSALAFLQGGKSILQEKHIYAQKS
jgi:hypothetical protein